MMTLIIIIMHVACSVYKHNLPKTLCNYKLVSFEIAGMPAFLQRITQHIQIHCMMHLISEHLTVIKLSCLKYTSFSSSTSCCDGRNFKVIPSPWNEWRDCDIRASHRNVSGVLKLHQSTSWAPPLNFSRIGHLNPVFAQMRHL